VLRLYAAALPPLRECAVRVRNLPIIRLHRAAAYSQSGQIAEARAEAAEVLRITEHQIDGLRKAGLPEC